MSNIAYELKLANAIIDTIAEAALSLPSETPEEALSTLGTIRLCCEESYDRLAAAMGPQGLGPAETLSANHHIPA